MTYNTEVRQAGKAGARHGDVYIVRIDELPDGLKLKKTRVLAEGEVTGHHHMLQGASASVEVYEQEGTDELIMQVFGDDVSVVHQEHAEVELMPGDYRVFVQEEHDPLEQEMRKVAD